MANTATDITFRTAAAPPYPVGTPFDIACYGIDDEDENDQTAYSFQFWLNNGINDTMIQNFGVSNYYYFETLGAGSYVFTAKVSTDGGTNIDVVRTFSFSIVSGEYPAGGEKRFTCNGSVDLSDTPASILKSILSSMDASAVYTQGRHVIVGGVPKTPSGITIDESWLNGAVSFTVGSDKNSLYNTATGTFCNPDDHWASSAFPTVKIDEYVTDDKEELTVDQSLNWTTSGFMAQRLARMAIERSRRGTQITLPCNYKALGVDVDDVKKVTIGILGWSEMKCRVINWQFSQNGIDLTLGIDDSDLMNLTSADLNPLALPVLTNIPDPFTVPAPTGLTASEELYSGNTPGVIKTRVNLSWTAPGQNIYRYNVQWSKTDGFVWYPLTAVADTSARIEDAPTGPIIVRINAVNSLGSVSPWSEIFAYTVIGKTAPPPPVDTFLVSRQPDGTRQFDWAILDPPLDLAGYKIRYVSGSSGTWSGMNDLHTGLLPASPFETNQLAAGTYTFAIISVDTTGNESTPKYISLTIEDPRTAGVFYSVSCSKLGWPGTKTNCYVNEYGNLVATGSKTWADFATDGVTWATWTQWNRVPSTPIMYEHPVIDIGAVRPFTPSAENVVSVGTATAQMATSNDGSSYSSWGPVGFVTARYIKIRLSVAGSSPQLLGASIFISGAQVTEEINDYTPTTGDFRLPLSKSYAIIQSVFITMQNIGPGWSWELKDKNATSGPRIITYNSSGAATACTIDATIRGL